MTLGRIAYEAYGNAREWATATGGSMPTWDQQRPELREAWDVAGYAVARAIQQAAAGMQPVIVSAPLTDAERRRLEAAEHARLERVDRATAPTEPMGHPTLPA